MNEGKIALFISPVIPKKNGIGIQQRAYRNLHLLSCEYEVDVIIATEQSTVIPNCLTNLGVRKIIFVKDRYVNAPQLLAKIIGMQVLWRLFWLSSRDIRTWFRRRDYKTQLCEVTETNYDLTLVFRTRACWLHDYLVKYSHFFSRTAILDIDDIDSIAKQRMLEDYPRSSGLQKRLSIYIDIILAKRAEKKILGIYNGVWVCSEIDKQYFDKKGVRKANIVVMPNTIYIPQKLPASAGKQRIMFLGAMHYYPNIDAVEFYCKNVLPKLSLQLGMPVEFFIVGDSPAEEVKLLSAQEGVTVTGRVENLMDFYRETDIIVVPIRSGGGTRIKILEAMAFGRLVISTPIGCEGLGVLNSREIVIANTADNFVELCAKYLVDRNQKSTIESKAREFVEKNYSFENALALFRKYYC